MIGSAKQGSEVRGTKEVHLESEVAD